jgi:hypothetical protein
MGQVTEVVIGEPRDGAAVKTRGQRGVEQQRIEVMDDRQAGVQDHDPFGQLDRLLDRGDTDASFKPHRRS